MQDTYNKARKLHEQADDKYVTDVEVSIRLEDTKDATLTVPDFKTEIPYSIEIEYRSWGIKDIYVNLYDEVDIDYIEEEDTGEDIVDNDRTVKVDLSQLPVEWVKSGIYSPEKIELYIKKDGTVDYSKSYVEIGYISKG